MWTYPGPRATERFTREMRAASGLARLEHRLLSPAAVLAHEDVDRAALCTDRALPVGGHRKRVLGERHADAEEQIIGGVVGLEIGLLAPGTVLAHEDVSRAGTASAVVGLPDVRVVHAPCGAGFHGRTDDDRVAIDGHAAAEHVASFAVAGLEIRLLLFARWPTNCSRFPVLSSSCVHGRSRTRTFGHAASRAGG
jgi:hypothetical protein